MYIHLYPHSFHTDFFLAAFKHTIKELYNEDLQSLFLKTDQFIIDSIKDKNPQPAYDMKKVNGISLPQFSDDVIGNIIILPINCPKDNNATMNFIFGLFNLLILMRTFNFRAVLTTSPVPFFDGEDFGELYLDHVPSNIQGFIGNGSLNHSEVDELWDKLTSLYDVASRIDSGTDRHKILLALMMTASANSFRLFFEIDRLILKNVKELYASSVILKVLPVIEKLIPEKRRMAMNALVNLAQFAGKERLIGKNLEVRYAKLKPFDLILKLVEKRGHSIDRDILIGAAVDDIFTHLHRIADEKYKPGATKKGKIEQYVRCFFDEVLDGMYQGNIERLIRDKRILRSAYVFYLEQGLAMKKEETADETK